MEKSTGIYSPFIKTFLSVCSSTFDLQRFCLSIYLPLRTHYVDFTPWGTFSTHPLAESLLSTNYSTNLYLKIDYGTV